MKMIKAIVAGLVMLAVVGCASNQNKSNYTAYLETVQKIESNKAIAEESSRIAKSQSILTWQPTVLHPTVRPL